MEVFDHSPYRMEYIYVNDGSSDDTPKQIESLINMHNAGEDANKHTIIGINFSRNFGKEAAIYAGLERSTGTYVSIIDADLQ